jgi:hypothetical protein
MLGVTGVNGELVGRRRCRRIALPRQLEADSECGCRRPVRMFGVDRPLICRESTFGIAGRGTVSPQLESGRRRALEVAGVQSALKSRL